MTTTTAERQMIRQGYDSVREQLDAAPPGAPNLAAARKAFDLIRARGGPDYIERIGRISTKQVMIDMYKGLCPECGSDQGTECSCFIDDLPT